VKREPLEEPLVSWGKFFKEEAMVDERRFGLELESRPKSEYGHNSEEEIPHNQILVTPDKSRSKSPMKNRNDSSPRRNTITGPSKTLKQFRENESVPPITLQFSDGTVLVCPVPLSTSSGGRKSPKDRPLSPNRIKRLANDIPQKLISSGHESTKSEKKNQS